MGSEELGTTVRHSQKQIQYAVHDLKIYIRLRATPSGYHTVCECC